MLCIFGKSKIYSGNGPLRRLNSISIPCKFFSFANSGGISLPSSPLIEKTTNDSKSPISGGKGPLRLFSLISIIKSCPLATVKPNQLLNSSIDTGTAVVSQPVLSYQSPPFVDLYNAFRALKTVFTASGE